MSEKQKPLYVYLHPNGDGVHMFLVAARNQREACSLIGTTVGDFRRHGGRRVGADTAEGVIALSEPGRVWKRTVMSVTRGRPEPWVYDNIRGAR